MKNPARLLPLIALSLAIAGPASAKPAGRVIDLRVGEELFFKSGDVQLAVDSPEIATAELLPSRELLLTGKAPGRTLLYLMDADALLAVRLRVRETGGKSQELHATEEQLAAAKKVCPKLEIEKGGEGMALSAQVSSGECRRALLALLDTDDFPVEKLSLMFAGPVLQEQLAELRARADKAGLKGIKLAYLGATLRIEGKLTAAQKLELLKLAYEVTPGPLLLDDRSELDAPAAAADAGTPPPEAQRGL